MKKKILLGVALLLSFSCMKKEEAKKSIRPVRLYKVEEPAKEGILNIPAVVTAKKESFLGFRVAGPVLEIYGDIGKKFRVGETLAILDQRDYIVNLKAWERKYEAAEKGYLAVKAAAENAELQYKRVETLYKNKATTKKQYDEALAMAKSAIAKEKAAYAQMEEAKQGLENAKNNLKDTELVAPYDGYLVKKMAESGSVVGAGTPVVMFVSDENPQIGASISEKDIVILEKSKNFTFLEQPIFLKEIGKRKDFTKQNYPVTFEFSNKPDFMIGKEGNIVVTFAVDENSKVKVPLQAVFKRDGVKVWIYRDGKVKSQEVILGNLAEDGYVFIEEGVSPGDEVVTAGVYSIGENDSVKPLPEESKSNVGNLL
jgi:RND family efflux transporter MFP subunit